MRDEGGYTLVELLTGIAVSLLTMTVVTMMITVATHNQDRVAKRVMANQRVRPVMTQMIDSLHSACVAPRIAPVFGGSTGASIAFTSKSGSQVSPTPDKRVITLSGTTLSESIYPATGGTAPTWTFSGTATSTRTLLTDVSAPSGAVFRYYDFQNGQLSTTPLATPLSDTNAARVAYVSVTLTAAPNGGASALDPGSPITVSDAADLRLQPASQVATQDNLPCT